MLLRWGKGQKVNLGAPCEPCEVWLERRWARPVLPTTLRSARLAGRFSFRSFRNKEPFLRVQKFRVHTRQTVGLLDAN